MNAFVDFTARALAIRHVLSLRTPYPKMRPYLHAAQLRLLDRIEHGIADRLRASGMSSDAAMQSALAFVCKVVNHHRAAAA
jgi:hypothetical protein